METTSFETNAAAKDGQTKCPKCGATDISLNPATGQLRCNFCRHTFEAEALDDMKSGVGDLHGEQVSTGASDISNAEDDQTMTLKCTSCGAEVVINLQESTQARCHWCRNTLSVNSKVPNGAVPDVVLPFKMKKDEAKQRIEEYVGKKKFFANKNFRNEFTTDNVMGVYFPYMLVDMKGHACFSGEGEVKTGSYTRTTGSGDNKHTETIYKVDSYSVFRECDVEIDDLTVESSSRRAGAVSGKVETNNIINAILPFDTENSVKYDSNFLKGYTSEKRDVNKSDLQPIVDSQEKEAIKFQLNKSVEKYDRGVRWDNVQVNKQGEKWLAAYLPVWLYSYVQNPGKSNALTHYVAVNARTAETIGSVPLNLGRIWPLSFLVGIVLAGLGFLGAFFIKHKEMARFGTKTWLIIAGIFLVGLFGFFFIQYSRYRNTSARHHFENETKINVANIGGNDTFLRKFETRESTMSGANNKTVYIEKLQAPKNG
ncbi:MAG: TFIIB-type zinc ribbon-containing protein [Eubacterium sp.]|nr:TFIIB-type zinc ribbon-containing protein [Eubacterium sp.]